jgi:glucosamine--fructose-6-phosphate aminotransferase (isomerizing)
VTATQVARQAGALTLAIVNDESSPAASASELVVPIGAGQEKSVAATKSVAMSMIAGTRLIAELSRDADLRTALQNLPRRMSEVMKCDWSAWSGSVATAPAAFVVARGYGLGPAREIALKLSETLQVPALGYSAAELRHGPRASVSAATPVLMLRQRDRTAASVDDMARDLRRTNSLMFIAGGAASTLPWIGDSHPALDPVLTLIPAYRAIEVTARQRGLDPDTPPNLTKVTQTL